MKLVLTTIVLSVLMLVAAAAPALAHHAFSAEFDINKPATLTGVITRVDWINPHAYLYLDVKDASGSVVNWHLETLPPLMARRGGMTKDMLPVGETVTVGAFLARDGSKLAWIKKISFADGRVLQVTAEEPAQTTQK